MRIYLYLVFTFVLFNLSCKEIPINIGDTFIPVSGRIVLLEDLTGASCPNCPKGAAVITNILNKYPEQVVTVGIHGFFLSNPTPKSIYDFRHPDARSLEIWFNPTGGKPAAAINRVRRSGNSLLSYLPDLWLSLVEQELQKSQDIEIKLEIQYNESSRKSDISVAVIPLVDLTGEFSISIYLTESKIIDAQSNGTEIVEDYEHNHVMRAMLTKFDGDALTTTLNKGVAINRSYTYTLPTEPLGLWKAENMYAVVMVSRNSTDSKVVLQAAEAHLK